MSALAMLMHILPDIKSNTPHIGSKFKRISDNKIFILTGKEIVKETFNKWYYNAGDSHQGTSIRNVEMFNLVENEPQNPEEQEELTVRWGVPGQDDDEAKVLGRYGAEVEFLWYLPNKDFSRANLQNINVAYIDFSGANFSHADLRGARLDHCIFRNANFIYCDLIRARLYNCIFRNANLTYAKIISGDTGTVGRTIINNCVFKGAIGLKTTGYKRESKNSSRGWYSIEHVKITF